MTVYCNAGFAQDIKEKNWYVAEFMSGMIYHFQNLSFGEGVKEIVYYMATNDSMNLISVGPGLTYGRRNKGIGCGFFIDYEEVQNLEGEELLTYVSEALIVESKKFEEKRIKNFDLDGFIQSLNEYFNQAMTLMRNGYNPSEGKILNEDINQAMLKKFMRL